MKNNLKYLLLVLLCTLMTSCARYIVPEKFPVDSRLMIMTLNSNQPIQVLVPENSETKYKIKNLKFLVPDDVYVNLNDLYRNTKDLINDVLVNHNIPMSPTAKKYLKITITSVQWEKWAWGEMYSAYLEFSVETGNGYINHYRVQDKAFMDVGRAVGGTTSRAVEEIFQDKKILSYIESR